jgi:hypothetical protein
MAYRVVRGMRGEPRLQRAAGDQDDDGAEPQADRPGPLQAGATRPQRTRESPREDDEPGCGKSESAENHAEHA